MRKLYEKYKEQILYIVFGVLTTAVNVLVYHLAAERAGIHYLWANAAAWIFSVVFAFVTNKRFVFCSKSWKRAVVFPEIAGFFLARALTGGMDMVLMWLFMDVLMMEEHHLGMAAKLVVNVLVIVLNYVAGRLWIFRAK